VLQRTSRPQTRSSGRPQCRWLLRAAAAQRADIYTKALNAETGWMTRAEVRELEDLSPEEDTNA
jgi:phage portal protein BeeE